MTELTPRGTSVCRGCQHDDLTSVLDLGLQPLANEMAQSQTTADPAFPLHLRACRACGLGQVGEYVLPEKIFGAEYPYFSSVSSSWVAHARKYAETMQGELTLTTGDLVMEIASNDGYLLAQMKDLGMEVLGIEPAEGVADVARAKGVPTISEFFGRETAERLIAEHGHPRLVAANNVMAHVPDLEDFVAGLSILCNDETVITIENPSFINLLREAQFDTIYHEHFSYLTAHAVAQVVARFNLALVRVDALATHGGSNRYWLSRRDTRPLDPSVQATIEDELSTGLLSPELWATFADRSTSAIHGLRTWLDERKADGQIVAAYGAAAKGNTLMNAAQVRADDLIVVVDGSEQKQGKFLPGSHVPVAAPEQLTKHDVNDVLILPWNIAAEIVPLVHSLAPRARCWIAVPSMQQIG